MAPTNPTASTLATFSPPVSLGAAPVLVPVRRFVNPLLAKIASSSLTTLAKNGQIPLGKPLSGN
jgi:hypothetical protein